ncbi:hypothetical protein ACXR2T_03650 [Leucobacter sp. HY1910]
MSRSRFERFLPWSGVIAAVCWTAQMFVGVVGETDDPGGASVQVLREHTLANMVHMALLMATAMSLVYFAAATRAALRATEAAEAGASAVAFGGWLLVAVALAQMAVRDFALLSAAADGNAAATTAIGYLAWPGWVGMLAGLATVFVSIGIGALRGGALPRWFAIVTLILGVLVTLGALHIPPGGMIGYLLLPLWLVVAALLIARSQRHERAAVG